MSVAIRAGISVSLLALVAFYASTSISQIDWTRLSIWPICLAAALLTLTLFIAALRLQLATRDFGYPIAYRDCLAATACGNAAGYLFFQLPAQIATRAALLGRVGVAAEVSTLTTLYERFVALGVSGTMAAIGALYLFGQMGHGLNAEGKAFAKILVAMIVVVGVVAAIAWRDLIVRHARAVFSLRMILRICRLTVITVVIQGATLGAFVLAASQFSMSASLPDIVGATTIVMFAAAIPISFAGWGVREFSAVAALGAVGVPAAAALSMSVLVGVLSLLAVAAVTAGALATLQKPVLKISASGALMALNPAIVTSWTLPLAAAAFIFFHLRVPISGGFATVSPADIFVVVMGTLVALQICQDRGLRARLRPFLWFCAVSCAAVGAAYLHGVWAFGHTHWAGAKLFGWMLLLGYTVTAISLVVVAGREGARRIALTMVATCCAIVVMDLLINFRSGLFVRHEGFSANPNAFAFQILMSFIIGFAVLRGEKYWPAAMAVMFFGMVATGSRSGIGAFAIVGLLALLFRAGHYATVAKAAAAAGVALCLWHVLASGELNFWRPVAEEISAVQSPDHQPAADGAAADVTGSFLIREASNVRSSDAERWTTLQGAYRLLSDSPVFGAGLGYFYAHTARADGTGLVIHSIPFWLLAEFGAAGFALFCFFGLALFFTALRAARGRDDMGRDDMGLLLVLSATAFALMGLVQDVAYQRTFWFTLGVGLPFVIGAVRRGGPDAGTDTTASEHR